MFLLSYALHPADERLNADTVALSVHATHAQAVDTLYAFSLTRLSAVAEELLDALTSDGVVNSVGNRRAIATLLGTSPEQVAARLAEDDLTDDLLTARLAALAEDATPEGVRARLWLCEWLFAYENDVSMVAFFEITPTAALAAPGDEEETHALRFEAATVITQHIRLLAPGWTMHDVCEGLNTHSLVTTLAHGGTDGADGQFIEDIATGVRVAQIIEQSSDGEYYHFE